LVGINPGLESARIGHHFAGRGNRFWRLLHASGLVPELLLPEHDRRLAEFGFGVTNIAARPTRSCSDLGPQDFQRGRRLLARKVRAIGPELVAFVGVVAFREYFEDKKSRVEPGLRPESIAGARVFVLPNPSGRNAHFGPERMLAAYQALERELADYRRGKPACRPDGDPTPSKLRAARRSG
jgi:TDG/mug DNA glycosylase family protein